MAFDPANLVVAVNSIGGGNLRMHFYKSDDDLSEITSAGYITRAASYGLRVGDLVFIAGFADPGSRSEVGFISAITAGNGTIEIQQDAYLNPFGLMTFGDPAEVDDWAERLAATAAANQTVTLPPGVYATSSVTIPSTATLVMMPGAVLRPASGATVTVNGKFSADPEQRIFDLSQGGTVFPSGNKEWSFIWFGAYNDASNGAANAIAKAGWQRAYDLLTSASYNTLLIPSGRYENSGANNYTDMFVLWKDSTRIIGAGKSSTWVKFGFQLMSDDTSVEGVTSWLPEYGFLFDDEEDTSYPAYLPRNGGPTRDPSYVSGRALRRTIRDVGVFGGDYAYVNLDNNPDLYGETVHAQQCGVAWIECKAASSGDDVGNTHLTNWLFEQSTSNDIQLLKWGTFSLQNGKCFRSASSKTLPPSIYAFVRSHSDPDSTTHEVGRQLFLDNVSLESSATTDAGRRSLGITAVADAGGGMIQLTLNGNHYIQAGHFKGNIEGTTSYNEESVIVNSVVSDTAIIVRKESGSFTFGSSETGTLTLPAIDLWLESEDGESAEDKRLIRTVISGGDINSLVAINCRSITFAGGIYPKESAYFLRCEDVLIPAAQYGFNKGSWSSDTRYEQTYQPMTFDVLSFIYRAGWGDQFDDDGYFSFWVNGNRWRLHQSSTAPRAEWVSETAIPRMGSYYQTTHGTGEIGSYYGSGQNASGTKRDYAGFRFNVTDATAGSEDATIRMATYVAGTFGDRFTIGNGMYSVGASGSDPGAGAINVSGTYRINGTTVMSARITGWGSPTGTATRTTFATTTVTLEQLAERVKALIDDLKTLGPIGT